jgi:hypothetical protein
MERALSRRQGGGRRGARPVIDLNALLRRRVAYYEYPWVIERYLLNAQARYRALFQADDVGFIFAKSMPRSGHRYLATSLAHYFRSALNYCEYYSPPGCCGIIPCTKPYNEARTNRLFMQKSHDFGFRDSPYLNGKYLIQYRSPIPRLQSNFDLYARDTGRDDPESFRAFAEEETTYFINFYRKWIASPPANALVLAYEELTENQPATLAAALSFVQGRAAIDQAALAATLAATPPGALRDATAHRYFDPELFRRLERRVAEACGTERIRFHFLT